MAQDGYIQTASDGAGKRVENSALLLPIGTVVKNADGTETTLTVETVAFRQRVVIGDPSVAGNAGFADVRDSKLQVEDRTLHMLTMIAHTLEEINFKLSVLMS